MKESIKKRIEAVRRGEVPEGYRIENGYLISDDWKTVPLNSRFTRSTKKNSTGCENVLTISAQMGLVNQREFYDKDIASEDKSGYFLMKNGEFAYNKSYSTGYPYGAIKYLTKYDEGIVSPLYICFAPKAGTNTAFYTQYFEGGRYNREIYRVAQEGARNHGLLNIAVEDFFTGILVEPSAGEQQKIAKILATCDRMIELKQHLVDEYKKAKKVFLRRLFPTQGVNVPELRFPGFKGEWRKCQLGELSDFITKGATPTTYGYQWETTGIPFFRNDSIQDNRFVYGEYSFISETAHKALSRSEVKGDDILIAITGDIGKVGIVPKDVIRGNINQHMARVRIIKDALPFFIYQYLCAATMQNNYQVIKTGISMPQLSLEQIRNTEILLPSLEEQQCIASCLKNLDEAIELRLQELEEVQQQKKALMQLLLTGLVRVNA